MKEEGEQPSKWLNKVTRDQNLDELAQLTLPTLTGLRRWYRSQILLPQIYMGYYDDSTGKIVLGRGTQTITGAVTLTGQDAPSQLDAEKIVTDTSVNTTSQASFTLTCPADTAYRVICASMMNSTRVYWASMVYTPSGGTASTIFTGTQSTTTTANKMVMIGGQTMNATGDSDASFIEKGLWMQAGDTLTLTNLNFVAADSMQHDFIFETYAV